MKADPHDMKTVFGFEKQLFAPLFQRPYVWTKKDQWEPLWQDVKRVAAELLAGNEQCKPHFLGAVVLDQMRVPIGKPDARSIIDGQQRLTTLQLLMEAVRDLCRDRPDLDLQRRRIERLVENQDVREPEDRYKVWPTNVDRPVYRAIMETPCPKTLRARIKEVCPDRRSRLADAYEYFHKVIGDWLALDEKGAVERCDALVNAIREKLRIVVIDMDDRVFCQEPRPERRVASERFLAVRPALQEVLRSSIRQQGEVVFQATGEDAGNDGLPLLARAVRRDEIGQGTVADLV